MSGPTSVSSEQHELARSVSNSALIEDFVVIPDRFSEGRPEGEEG
jgi:hypothetical protein